MSEPQRKNSPEVAPIRLQTLMRGAVPVIALGKSLGLFLAVSFVLCVGYGLLFPAAPMHPAWAPFLPGFTWLSWPSFFLGLGEAYVYGWYVALVFGPLYNYFAPSPN